MYCKVQMKRISEIQEQNDVSHTRSKEATYHEKKVRKRGARHTE